MVGGASVGLSRVVEVLVVVPLLLLAVELALAHAACSTSSFQFFSTTTEGIKL